MRTFTLVLSAILLTLISTRVLAATDSKAAHSKVQTCRIVTGYGTAIGHGHTKLEAQEQARLTCGTQLIDQYFAQRREIPEDVKEDLALACVNLDCQ